MIATSLFQSVPFCFLFYSTTPGSASASSGSTIIGENTGVFIGGLPQDFTLLREDSGIFNICVEMLSVLTWFGFLTFIDA